MPSSSSSNKTQTRRKGRNDDDDEFSPFKRWFPWLVPAIVAANTAMFLVTMYVNDCPRNSGSNCFAGFLGRLSFQPLKENPLLGPSSDTLTEMGALDVSKLAEHHQGWRLITAIWLHAGVVHLLANMLGLLFIGLRLEKEFGFIRIGLLYMISGLGGNLLSALFIQSSISVGASGALFGLLGGMLSELIINWTIYANKVAALITLLLIVIINLAVGILPHVDNFAHIGGFISGFLLGFLSLIRPHFGWVRHKHAPPGYIVSSAKSKHKPYQYVLLVVSTVLLISGFCALFIMVLKGVNGNSHCSWCHYLSCVPTSLWSCKPQQVFCESSSIGSSLNITCLSNGRSHLYNMTDENTSLVRQLCSQLCS